MGGSVSTGKEKSEQVERKTKQQKMEGRAPPTVQETLARALDLPCCGMTSFLSCEPSRGACHHRAHLDIMVKRSPERESVSILLYCCCCCYCCCCLSVFALKHSVQIEREWLLRCESDLACELCLPFHDGRPDHRFHVRELEQHGLQHKQARRSPALENDFRPFVVTSSRSIHSVPS